MSVDPSVTAALERAVADDPGNAALRLHLASLLVVAGDPARALEHAQSALAVSPSSTEALATARDAARALGDSARAQEYSRLLGALDGPGAVPVPAERGGPPPGAFDAPDDEPAELDEIDELEEALGPRVTLADVGGLEAV